MTEEDSVTSQLWRSVQAVVAAVVVAILFDIGVYRGFGFAGWAFFFAGSLVAYFLGTLHNQAHRSHRFVGVLLILVIVRILWLGDPSQIFLGGMCLATFAMTRNGYSPYLSAIAAYCAQSTVYAGVTLVQLIQHFAGSRWKYQPVAVLTVLLPVLAVIVFGGIFIAANPDVSLFVRDQALYLERLLLNFLVTIDVAEVMVMGIIFWLALGQLRPLVKSGMGGALDLFSGSGLATTVEQTSSEGVSAKAKLYEPFRNTLMAVSVLFAVYLIFEFQTLWFREFPQGFYYAGYAHRGAGWLTFALALSTATLSLIFSGPILTDPRLGRLQRLAWIWSAANLVLALAVFNRMWIYIDFNGMTRMRVVALYGITTVIAGFVLTIWKIRQTRSFVWLIHRQLWALALGISLLILTPVDYCIHRWNARQILAGNFAPAVQVTEHSVDLSGWLALVPLLESENTIIRNGVLFKLREVEQMTLSADSPGSDQVHWTATQIVHVLLRSALQNSTLYQASSDESVDEKDWVRFQSYAYQWY